MKNKELIRVGFVQNKPIFGNIQENLDRVEKLLDGHDADLFVFPELFATGYQFKDMAESRSLAEHIPGGTITNALIALAQKTHTYFVAGLSEIEADQVYNSSVIVGPEGYIGKYRKIHLFDTEKVCFQAGNLPLKIYDIAGAKVGVMICFDWRFPEMARTLALMGADLIAHPSNLVLPHCPQAMITRCLENRIFAVTADRAGIENRTESLKFIGQSQIVDPDGNILVRASETEEEVQVVNINLEKAREKFLTPHNHIFNDRREDLYRS
ncbi:MAG: nitrilase-related carbon-nitrogen hydrolase [Nitrospinaceae bacterium]